MSEYIRHESLFTSATNGVDLVTFQNTIWTNGTITTLFLGSMSDEDDVSSEITYKFIFNGTLSGAEETELDSLIASHTGKPNEPTATEEAIACAHKMIDEAAGDARDRHSTTSKGQDITYVEKASDAKKYKDAGYPADETGYEFVTAQKNATGVTATQAADVILGTKAAWRILGAAIEELRIEYKELCSAETDPLVIKSLANKGKALLDSI